LKAALVKYLLSCCQHPDGGLRDKPTTRPDFYHSLYAIAGLSASQYHYLYDPSSSNKETGNEFAFKWIVSDRTEGEQGDRVQMVHPVFVLPWGDAERTKSWWSNNGPSQDSKIAGLKEENLD